MYFSRTVCALIILVWLIVCTRNSVMPRKAGKRTTAAVRVVPYAARNYMVVVVTPLVALGGGPLPTLTKQKPLPNYPG